MKVKAGDTLPRLRHRLLGSALAAVLLVGSAYPTFSQNCQTATELDDATRNAITKAAQRYFDLASKGDAEALRQSAIPSLASDFSRIEATIKDRQPDLVGAQAGVKSIFSLETEGTAPMPRAEFYCGVFGKNGQTPGSAVFTFTDLPPGKYAVVLLEATSPAGRNSFSSILQQDGTAWKLGGLYVKPALVAGHDSDWFIGRARDYKAKGQLHNAWFYYMQAREMITPLSFMSTQASDKLYDEFQSVQPPDIPVDGTPTDLAAGTITYKLTRIRLVSVGNDLDLLVRYEVADASNADQAYQSNVAVIKAVAAKYPEVREAVAGVVARAADASGRDYGTLLAMKDIK